MMAASTDFRPEQVPNANYTRVPDFRQCPLLALKNDRGLCERTECYDMIGAKDKASYEA